MAQAVKDELKKYILSKMDISFELLMIFGPDLLLFMKCMQ